MTKSRYLHPILCLSVSAALSGCSVGPDFFRLPVPDVSGYTEDALPPQTASVDTAQGAAQTFVSDKNIPAEWWKIFESEPLNRLIAQALKTNPDLQAAEARLKQAQENLYAQQGSSFPTVDINVGRTRQKFSSATFGQPNAPSNIFTLHNASVDVSYGIDIFGKLRRAVEGLEAQTEAERFRYEAAYLTLTTNIVTAAVQEASLREQIGETENIVEIEREQLKVLNGQLELGGIAKQPVLAQEANLQQVLASLPPLQKQLAQTRTQLAILVGQTPAEKLDATFDLASLHLPEELPVSLPSSLVEQRPDIKASEALMRAANAQIGVATANMLPQISITGSYGSSTPSFSDLFSPTSIVWNLGAGLAQPIFHGGQLLHRKRGAEAAYDEAAASYKSTVLNAFGNVSDSLTALQYDADTLKAQAAAADAASQNLELVNSQYKFGGISHLSLLDAQRSYQQSKIALIQARAARIVDSAALFQSLGGGWWNRGKDMESAPVATPEEIVKPLINPQQQTKSDGEKL